MDKTTEAKIRRLTVKRDALFERSVALTAEIKRLRASSSSRRPRKPRELTPYEKLLNDFSTAFYGRKPTDDIVDTNTLVTINPARKKLLKGVLLKIAKSDHLCIYDDELLNEMDPWITKLRACRQSVTTGKQFA